MLLTGEVKDKDYQDPPRQQEALYAHSSDQYLKADAETGKHYYDLNAANKSYAGPWLFGKENVQVFVDGMKAQWLQWCPVPADLRDGVFLRGNVIYENPNGSYRMSTDLFEGVLHTEGRHRFFVGRTQHTFYGRNLPEGSLKVIANLNIALNQRLAHNPMMIPPPATESGANAYLPQNYSQNYSRPASYAPANYAPQNYPQQPVNRQPEAYSPTQNYQQPQTYQHPQSYQQPQNYPTLRNYPSNQQPAEYQTKPEIRF